MTVTDTDLPPDQYDGNDSTTEFPITFDFVDDDHIVVTSVLADSTEEVGTKDGSGTYDYSISGSTVTMNVAPATGTILVIDCNTPITQAIDLQRNRAAGADVYENALDKLTIISRDLKAIIDRCMKLSIASAGLSDIDVEMPSPSAGLALGWNVNADGLTNLANLSAYTISDLAEVLLACDYTDEMAEALHLDRRTRKRPAFSYNGGATAYTIKVGPGKIWALELPGKWDYELTIDAIASPVADTWYFLCVDYSTLEYNTNLTKDNFRWAQGITPTFNGHYDQWLDPSTNDTIIFAVRTNSGPTNILPFYHDGGRYVEYEVAIKDLDASQALTNAWSDLALTIPSFSKKAIITALSVYTDASDALYKRVNGASGSTAHILTSLVSNSTRSVNSVSTLTDENQKIELFASGGDSDNYHSIYTDGFYLPIGM